MDAIVSVTSNWAIGRDGKLLVRNKADMRRFVELTMGGTVLMGRKTYESFPKGPLKGRRNVIVTRNHDYQPPNVPDELPPNTSIEVVHSLDEALDTVGTRGPQGAATNHRYQGIAHTAETSKVWLIGGESLYRSLLPHCTQAYVTKNDVIVQDADAFFPDLDASPHWRIASTNPGGVTQAGIAFEFVTYTRTGLQSPSLV